MNAIKTIKDRVGQKELLAQLCEEAIELAEAALKMRRTMDNQNPTPRSFEECKAALTEEVADVELCLHLIQDCINARDIAGIRMHKITRWLERLEEADRT